MLMLFSKKLMCRARLSASLRPPSPCSSSSSIIDDLPCSEYASQSNCVTPLRATPLPLPLPLLLLLLLLLSPLFLVTLNEDEDEDEEFDPLRRVPVECP